MIFNSIEYGIFLTIFLTAYYIVHTNETQRDLLLLGGSYFFYMSWFWQYAGLIALSTVVDYTCARGMSRSASASTRKILVTLSLSFNLGMLALFKYYDFFVLSINRTVNELGFEPSLSTLELVLPVGISFYTFQTMSYSIDVYRRRIQPEASFIKFSTYVAFFPQLVAGPIVRARTFLPQLRESVTLTPPKVQFGFFLIVIGLSKKIFIADLLAFYMVDHAFADPLSFSSVDLLVSLYAYAFQIYCDFSGYSDIAIGTALLLGFTLPTNFNKPYLAQSPSDFWRRWHITLSEWLRDYLYIPLGGNAGSAARVARNLLITMVLGGLWHGAAWNFIVWGLWHGLILIALRDWSRHDVWSARGLFQITVTFHLVLFSWLLFRVPDLSTFRAYVDGLSMGTDGTVFSPIAYSVLLLAVLSHFIPVNIFWSRCGGFFNWRADLVFALILLTMFLLFAGASLDSGAFIYFQF